jgi:hypothetical protein
MATDGGLRDAISTLLAADRYRRCLLLVHLDPNRLDRVAAELGRDYGWSLLSLGRPLAEALRDVAPPHRGRMADRWLKTRLGREEIEPVLCTEIDLLCEPRLGLDPLVLFSQAGRVKAVVVAWPGRYDGDVLEYATPEHGHFRVWHRPDVMALSLCSMNEPRNR